ncbi:MAG TPA: cyclic nucleotide-binding domain-containing protein [Deltaproteobacteria bacterium]|nr:cyclic nucleotide-binding domain-containing protein [Deltaproteobacteria bacterium]
MSRDFPTKTFYSNEVIFREGSRGESAYILKQGRVEISVGSGEKRVVLTVLRPVSVFGEMAVLLKDQRRTATATALDFVEAVEVDKDSFVAAVKKSPSIVSTVLGALVERLQRTTAKVSRTPDLFLGLCNMLDLLDAHGAAPLLYDRCVKAACGAFLAERTAVMETLGMLEALGLVTIDRDDAGRKVLSLKNRRDFLKQAYKLHCEMGDTPP